MSSLSFFCVKYTATHEIYPYCNTLSLRDALPISAANFIYPRSLGAETEAAITKACMDGGTTFHGLGIMPGFFAESLPLLMSKLARRVDCVIARSEEHTSELQSLMRISYAVFCLQKQKHKQTTHQ